MTWPMATMPRIEQIRLYRLKVPLQVPYRLAFGLVEHFDTIVVECASGDGATGLGEATVLTGYTDETIDDSWAAAGTIADELAALDTGAARHRLDQLLPERPFVSTAFGTALEMLAGSPHLRMGAATAVPILAVLNATGEAALREEIERLLAAGYRTLKVKVGFGVDKDAAHVALVQRILGGRAQIRLDANQGYSAAQGVAFVRTLDPAGIELFEQPCAAGDWDSHMAVARESRVPMMLDESIYGMADIERAAALEAAAYIKLKLMKLGSLEALAQALARIRSLGMEPVLGNGVACDLGCWMEACIAARHIRNAGEMNGFLKPRGALLATPLDVRDGAIQLDPAFSPRLARERMEPFIVASRDAARGALRRAADYIVEQ
ncbi:MAG: mandelate racemase/muconate lactonizing enzyme family protein [Burkholderiales bacterium]